MSQYQHDYFTLDPDGGGGGGYSQPASWDLLTNEFTLNIQQGQPTEIDIEMILRNYNDYSGYGQFSGYDIQYQINQGSTADWLTLTASNITPSTGVLVMSPSSSVQSVRAVINPANLPNGSVIGYITFTLVGNGQNGVVVLDSRTVTIYATFSGGQVTTVDKNSYRVDFLKLTNQLSGDLAITLSGVQSGHTYSLEYAGDIISLAQNGTLWNIGKGSGMDTLPTGSFQQLLVKLKDGSTVIQQVPVMVSVFADDKLKADPTSIELSTLKNSSIPATATVRVSNPAGKSYTVAWPYFLEPTSSGGNTSGNIDIKTKLPATLSGNNHSGVISITSGTDVLTIPVRLSIISFVVSEYATNQLDFCLDKKKISVFKNTENGRFARLMAEVTYRTAIGTRTSNMEMQAVYFNGRASFDLGQKVQAFCPNVDINMLSVDNPAGMFNPKTWYETIEVKVRVEELDVDYNVLKSEELETILLLPGARPLAFPFLTNHPVRTRILGAAQIIPFVGGLVSSDNISGKYSSFAGVKDRAAAAIVFQPKDILPEWTDCTSFWAGTSKLLFFTKKHSANLISIQWRNRNKMPEFANFSGEFKIRNDKNHIYSDLKDGRLEKYDVENSKVYTMDTGYILNAERPMVDELVDSRMVYIYSEGKMFRGFCTSNKIEITNSSDELVRFELEFLVEKI